jgi:hypothetical protein
LISAAEEGSAMPTNLAAETRGAVRERPFLHDALRAGVLNYAAAARALDIDGESEAVAAALRRYAEELDPPTAEDRDVRVTMESALGEAEEGPFAVNGNAYASGAGSLTGVLAVGEVDAAALRAVLGRLHTAGVTPEAAGVAGDALFVVVPRRAGPDAVRAVEAALASVPG